jgi:2-hydroxychromene-2-carboxylate isomerase
MRRSIRAEIASMGDLRVLAERRAASRRGESVPRGRIDVGWGAQPIAFCFDPGCPFSYLVAERVERRFSAVEWIPVAGAALHRDRWSGPDAGRALRAHAERRAAELRLPLVWPDRFPSTGMSALRVAVYAARVGLGPAFALAASRLAFCGGFDLEDPENLAEAAAAAGIELEACMLAANDQANDVPLEAAARGLLAHGVTELPAFGLGTRWFAGEHRLAEASAWARAPLAATQTLPG